MTSEAQDIKGAQSQGYNSAERIGRMFEDIIQYLGEHQGSGGSDSGGGGDGDVPSGTGLTMQTVWNNLAASGTSRQIHKDHLTNALSGYATTSAMNTALGNRLLKSTFESTTWWGRSVQTVNNQSVVKGDMTDVGNISMSGNLTMSGKLNINGIIIEKDSPGILKFNGSIYATGGVSALGNSSGGGGGGTVSLGTLLSSLDASSVLNTLPPSGSYYMKYTAGSGWSWSAGTDSGGTSYDPFDGHGAGLVPSATSETYKDTKFLNANGIWAVPAGSSVFSGGSPGLVPNGTGVESTKFLCADGQWKVPAGSGGGGTVTSIKVSVVDNSGLNVSATGANSSGAVTTSGIFTIGMATGYEIPSSTKLRKLDTLADKLSGNKLVADKLTTNTYTLWGETYILNGVPQSVDNKITVHQLWLKGKTNGVTHTSGLYIDNRNEYGTINWWRDTMQYDGTFCTFQRGDTTGSFNDESLVVFSSRAKFGQSVIIDGCKLTWNPSRRALEVTGNDGSAANLYATGGISALGFQSGGISSLDTFTFNSLTVNSQIDMPDGCLFTGDMYIGNTECSIYGITENNINSLRINGGDIIISGDALKIESDSTTLNGIYIESGEMTIPATGSLVFKYGNKEYEFNVSAAISTGILTER